MTTVEAADIDEEARPSSPSTSRSRGRWEPRRRGGQRRPPVQQLRPPDRLREPLGREGRRRPRAADAVLIDSIRIPVDVVERSRQASPPTPSTRRYPWRLLRMAARTAVVAGTATAVSGRVQRRQAAKWDEQDAQQYAGAAAAGSAAATGRARGRGERATPESCGAARSGRAHRRGVRGREGQDPRDLTAAADL